MAEISPTIAVILIANSRIILHISLSLYMNFQQLMHPVGNNIIIRYTTGK